MENLRNIYLFVAAIEKGTEFPGTQAGVADMISSARDLHTAGIHRHSGIGTCACRSRQIWARDCPDLNEPYFHLYKGNLTNIESWTKTHMKGLPGSCVPETMRFNGRGIEYESTWDTIAIGMNCDAAFKPYYNARTLSTGAEVSLWVWKHYLATNDRAFLAENYPLMASSARFLLAYQKMGADGLLHTSPTNAHEQQWDVTDSTTDISAIKALYPATIEAAKLLDKDPDLVNKLQAALPKIPPLAADTAECSPHVAGCFCRRRRHRCACRVLSPADGGTQCREHWTRASVALRSHRGFIFAFASRAAHVRTSTGQSECRLELRSDSGCAPRIGRRRSHHVDRDLRRSSSIS